jgi:hypothetical protein
MNPAIKSDSAITYNHMEAESNTLKRKTKKKLILRFVAEEVIIALLLALIFYMI